MISGDEDDDQIKRLDDINDDGIYNNGSQKVGL